MASPKLLDQVRIVARVRHLSLKTEKAYAQWIKRFILFHKKRHPMDMAEPEIREFLAHLCSQPSGFSLYPNRGSKRDPVPLPRRAQARPALHIQHRARETI